MPYLERANNSLVQPICEAFRTILLKRHHHLQGFGLRVLVHAIRQASNSAHDHDEKQPKAEVFRPDIQWTLEVIQADIQGQKLRSGPRNA